MYYTIQGTVNCTIYGREGRIYIFYILYTPKKKEGKIQRSEKANEYDGIKKNKKKQQQQQEGKSVLGGRRKT